MAHSLSPPPDDAGGRPRRSPRRSRPSSGHVPSCGARASCSVYTADALPGYRKFPSLAVFPSTRDAADRRRAGPRRPRGSIRATRGRDRSLGRRTRRRRRADRPQPAAPDPLLDPHNAVAVVEPGVVNATLSRAAAPFGLYYAPDPSSQAACTIGGNVAENSGGPHCLKYGVTLNHVLGVTAILPNGDIVALGAGVTGGGAGGVRSPRRVRRLGRMLRRRPRRDGQAHTHARRPSARCWPISPISSMRRARHRRSSRPVSCRRRSR